MTARPPTMKVAIVMAVFLDNDPILAAQCPLCEADFLQTSLENKKTPASSAGASGISNAEGSTV
jgi:hypothetical protein